MQNGCVHAWWIILDKYYTYKYIDVNLYIYHNLQARCKYTNLVEWCGEIITKINSSKYEDYIVPPTSKKKLVQVALMFKYIARMDCNAAKSYLGWGPSFFYTQIGTYSFKRSNFQNFKLKLNLLCVNFCQCSYDLWVYLVLYSHIYKTLKQCSIISVQPTINCFSKVRNLKLIIQESRYYVW